MTDVRPKKKKVEPSDTDAYAGIGIIGLERRTVQYRVKRVNQQLH